MNEPQILARSLHDLGLAAWFGGSLMGAVGLNETGARASHGDAAAVAGSGWAAWTPVSLAAIGMHLVGGAGLVMGNGQRMVGQQCVGSATIAKTAITAAALGCTAYARAIGQRVIAHPESDAKSGTQPSESTRSDVAAAQRQLRVLQWAIPVLTGSLVVMSAIMGEQQRPTSIAHGLLERLNPLD